MNVIWNDFKIWKCFVKEGVFDEFCIQKWVVVLWYCCKKVDVNFYFEKGLNVMLVDYLERQVEKYVLFLVVLVLYVEKMKMVMWEMEMMVFLIDVDGVVYLVDGYLCIIYEVNCINFLKGVCWIEKVVGMNVIGMVFYINELVMVYGFEYYLFVFY